jgi:O-methyltransferase
MRKLLKKCYLIANILYPGLGERLEWLNKKALFRKIILNEQIKLFENREELYKWVNETLIRNKIIDYLEFGVWKGESIQKWSGLNNNAESRFFGFDSFKGLPEDWNKKVLAGTFDLNGNAPVINDKRVTFVKGLFQNTLRSFLESYAPQYPLVVHVDSDIYTSALFCLTQLDHIMKPGTIIIFDEFSDVLHEFAAFYDYYRSYCRNWEVLGGCKGLYPTVIRML